VSWTLIVCSLKIYSIFLPLLHMILQALINVIFHLTGNDKNYEEKFYASLLLNSKFSQNSEGDIIKKQISGTCSNFKNARKKILLLSCLTSWITPFTVLKNSLLEKKFQNTFFSNRYLMLSSLAMHACTLLLVIGIISDLHIKIVHYQKSLLGNATITNENDITDNLSNLNSNDTKWFQTFIAFEANNAFCDDSPKQCQEDEIGLNMKLLFLTMLLVIFITTALLLQFFGNYYYLFRPCNVFPESSFFYHFTVLRNMLIDPTEQACNFTELIKKSRKSIFQSQDIMTGDTCLIVALKHGYIDLVKQMIQSGSDPTVTNFSQENIESLWKAQKMERHSELQWLIAFGPRNEEKCFKYMKAKVLIQERNETNAVLNLHAFQMQPLYFKILLNTTRKNTLPSENKIELIAKGMHFNDKNFSDVIKSQKQSLNKNAWFQSFLDSLAKKEKIKTFAFCLLMGLHTNQKNLNLLKLLCQLKCTYTNEMLLKLCWKKQYSKITDEKTKYSHYLVQIGNINMLKTTSKKKKKIF